MDNVLKIGHRNFHPKYGWYEVIDKIDNLYFSIKFDSTNYQYACTKYQIFNNKVRDRRHPSCHQVGEEYEHHIYGKYKIIELCKNKKAIIEFENTKYRCECGINNIIKQHVKDPTFPIICNIGYIGESRNVKRMSKTTAYRVWHNMIKRCYDKELHKKHPTYSKCEVCEEWHCFVNFDKWFSNNYVDNWCLDKDILIKGNKLYSPSTCCFVPTEINSLFTKRQRQRGETPIGVLFCKASRRFKSCFRAVINKNGCKVHIGCYDTAEKAFSAYKEEKEKYIKYMADKWKSLLAANVYDAMYNYKVEKTD